MSPARQARRERREADRKAKKFEVKKGRLAENHPLATADEFHEIQPRWIPNSKTSSPAKSRSATTP